MSNGAKCSICDETLPHNRSETAVLVQHLLDRHPEQQFKLTRSVKQKIFKDSPLDDCRFEEIDTQMAQFSQNPSAETSPKKTVVHHPRSSLGKKADENLPTKEDFDERHPRRSRMYHKTTVATWRPARARVTCPHCGQSRLPTIRSSADRYSASSTGAAWLLTCWPLCFLPCLFTAPTKHHLHCSGCDAYLGLYDPNREVVGRNQSAHGRRRTGGTSSRRV